MITRCGAALVRVRATLPPPGAAKAPPDKLLPRPRRSSSLLRGDVAARQRRGTRQAARRPRCAAFSKTARWSRDLRPMARTGIASSRPIEAHAFPITLYSRHAPSSVRASPFLQLPFGPHLNIYLHHLAFDRAPLQARLCFYEAATSSTRTCLPKSMPSIVAAEPRAVLRRACAAPRGSVMAGNGTIVMRGPPGRKYLFQVLPVITVEVIL